jgi:hypothetical protein
MQKKKINYSKYSKKYRERNPEKVKEIQKRCRERNRERNNALVKAWRIKNADKINKQYNEKMNEPGAVCKIAHVLRARVLAALKKNNNSKQTSTIELLGCSIEEARVYIESQFTEGMSWSNYGLHGWHIDHINPVSTFDLSDPEQQKQCFHYTNLRPLWAKDNWSRPKDGTDLI